MKKPHFLWLIFSLAISFGYAQQISYKNDLVLVGGKPFCKSSGSISGLSGGELSIYSLEGKELFYLKLHDQNRGGGSSYYGYFTMINMISEEQMEVEWEFGFKDKFMRWLYQDHVLDSLGGINVEGLRKFKLKHGCNCAAIMEKRENPITQQPQLNNNNVLGAILSSGGQAQPSSQPSVGNRDRMAMIFVHGQEIQQGGQTIGSYAKKSEFGSNSQILNRYNIYDTYGNLVASGSCPFQGASSIEMVTVKDNRSHIVSFSMNIDMEIVKAITSVLTSRLYL